MEFRTSRPVIARDEPAAKQSSFAHVIAIGLTALSIFLLTASSKGVTASPHAFVEEQPDGSLVELHMRGDEHHQWIEDARSFTVVRDQGRFVYGNLDHAGRVVGTQLVVARDDPRAAELSRHCAGWLSRRGTVSPTSVQQAPRCSSDWVTSRTLPPLPCSCRGVRGSSAEWWGGLLPRYPSCHFGSRHALTARASNSTS